MRSKAISSAMAFLTLSGAIPEFADAKGKAHSAKGSTAMGSVADLQHIVHVNSKAVNADSSRRGAISVPNVRIGDEIEIAGKCGPGVAVEYQGVLSGKNISPKKAAEFQKILIPPSQVRVLANASTGEYIASTKIGADVRKQALMVFSCEGESQTVGLIIEGTPAATADNEVAQAVTEGIRDTEAGTSPEPRSKPGAEAPPPPKLAQPPKDDIEERYMRTVFVEGHGGTTHLMEAFPQPGFNAGAAVGVRLARPDLALLLDYNFERAPFAYKDVDGSKAVTNRNSQEVSLRFLYMPGTAAARSEIGAGLAVAWSPEKSTGPETYLAERTRLVGQVTAGIRVRMHRNTYAALRAVFDFGPSPRDTSVKFQIAFGL